uniref:Uncharacterized protein n=1 Tax=Arundo donax TaxID=35708 RepID=A0A0A8XZJ3_ARUDO
MSIAFMPSLRVHASLECQYSLSISIVKLPLLLDAYSGS